jgi:RsiW-degrading membrane proteinase PrsW (M82 family)
VALRLPAFDEPLDGIIYASFIALGYAAIEN